MGKTVASDYFPFKVSEDSVFATRPAEVGMVIKELPSVTYDKVVDSGMRETFETGSRRDTRVGKGRFDLIPAYPLKRLAQHYENGAVKYGDRNWELGQPLSRYLDSAERHINAYKDGDRKEDHLTAVVWNIFSLLWTEEQVRRGNLNKELADLDKHLLHLGGKE